MDTARLPPPPPLLASHWPPLPIRAAGWVVLRTPLLPFDELIHQGEGLSAAQATGPAELDRALAADMELVRRRLGAALARPEVSEAILFASPGLHADIAVWREAPESARGRKVERALASYFARMAGRATPFGLFAGLSLGELGERSRLRLAGMGQYRRQSQLALAYLERLALALEALPEARRALRYHANTSLHRLQGEWRFLQRDGGDWHNRVATAPSTEVLDGLIARARDGGATRAELLSTLAHHEPDASPEEAAEFLQSLVDAQVLCSELTPAPIGDPPDLAMAETLERLPGLKPPAAALRASLDRLAAFDASPLGADPARYREVVEPLRALPAEVELPDALRMDLHKPAAEVTLGAEPLAEVIRGLKILQRISPPASKQLVDLRAALLARYEQREVPLLEALDDETGIGFGDSELLGAPTPLLQGLQRSMQALPPARLEARHRYLLARIEAVRRSGAMNLELDEADVSAIAHGPARPLPRGLAAVVQVAAESEEALDAGRFQVHFETVLGPSGARLLGRFCREPALRRRVEALLQDEGALDPGALVADVGHIPDGRVAEVVLHPVMAEYEIPFFGRAAVPPDRQIPIEDLLISVVGERIVLRSARHGREVIPRLTHGHNYGWHGNHPLYQFFGVLQAQGAIEFLRWEWGTLDAVPFLPRVTSGRLVLVGARWGLRTAELEPAARARGGARFRAVRELAEAMGLPRWILIGDSDHQLPVDLDNPLSVETLLHEVRRRDYILVREMPAAPDALCVRGPEGRFVHEMVIPFTSVQPRPARAAPSPPPVRTPDRSFLVGSEWLYAKLYAGPLSIDRLLADERLAGMLQRLVRDEVVDRWFFVRFADPDLHLRLRLHGSPGRLVAEGLPALHELVESLRASGLVWKLQLDTYEREVERYGGLEAMVEVERLFCADSEAVIALLTGAAKDGGMDESLRWRLAYLGADRLLGALGLTPADRLTLLEGAVASYRAEQHIDAGGEHRLSLKYRAEQPTLPNLLSVASGDGPVAAAERVFARRAERIAPIAAALRRLEAAGRLGRPIGDVAGSCMHMFANRLLAVELRAQELALYDFLRRTWRSHLAREAARRRGT